ncbi:MAG: efflux transporter outer membrane subunit [Burkholderiales bacterium]|nr:efflux transporter outer membrane subunit [Burkholderiales bacterium]
MSARSKLCLLAVALSGCSSLAPPLERPALPVAATFAGQPAGKQATAPVVTPEWQSFFGDARLRELITLALQNNRDLKLALLNIEQARAQLDLRRADQWPSLNAGLSGSRQPTSAGGINSSYSAGVLVTAYELDLFGRVRSLADATLAQYLATEEARKAVQISLLAAVANGYYALLGDEELLRITRQTLVTREDSYRLIKLRFDNGASSQIDLRQAESLLESARVTLAQATRQRALDQNALVLLLGQALPAGLPAALPLDVTASLPTLPVGLPSDVLLRRPDVRQAEQQLIAANASIGAARAAFFPRISLTGSVGSVSSELSGLFSNGMAWSFAPQLLQPIFDAGRNQANLRASEVGRDIALAQYERAIQSAFREVADALAGRATLGEQLRAQQAQLKAEQDRYRLAELRYRGGAASYLDALDAQRSLFTAQQALLQVQTQSLQNGVTLYRVLGGGWTAEGTRP